MFLQVLRYIKNFLIHRLFESKMVTQHLLQKNPFFYTASPVESIGLKFIPNQSELFRYMYPSQCESFRTNPKNVLYLVRWKKVKNQSDLIGGKIPNKSEWIRARIDPNRIFNSNHSDPRSIQIDSDWKFGLDQSELDFIRIEDLARIHSDSCLRLNRIKSDWFSTFFIQRYTKRFSCWFVMIRIGSNTDIEINRYISDWLGMNFNPIFSPGSRLMKHGQKSIWLNPNQVFNLNYSELGLIQTEFSIRINPNECEVGIIRMDSDLKFGLDQSELGIIQIENLVRIWFGFIRIESDWFLTVYHKIRYKSFFGLVRNKCYPKFSPNPRPNYYWSQLRIYTDRKEWLLQRYL